MSGDGEHFLDGLPELDIPTEWNDLIPCRRSHGLQRRSSSHDAENDIRIQKEAKMREDHRKVAEDVADFLFEHPKVRPFLSEKTREFVMTCLRHERSEHPKKEDHPLAWYWDNRKKEPSFESQCAMVSMLHDRYVGFKRIADEAVLIYPDLKRQLEAFEATSGAGTVNHFKHFLRDIRRSTELKTYLQGSGADAQADPPDQDDLLEAKIIIKEGSFNAACGIYALLNDLKTYEEVDLNNPKKSYSHRTPRLARAKLRDLDHTGYADLADAIKAVKGKTGFCAIATKVRDRMIFSE
jgi:hypothetical protein